MTVLNSMHCGFKLLMSMLWKTSEASIKKRILSVLSIAIYILRMFLFVISKIISFIRKKNAFSCRKMCLIARIIYTGMAFCLCTRDCSKSQTFAIKQEYFLFTGDFVHNQRLYVTSTINR